MEKIRLKQTTIFNTPIITPFLRIFSVIMLGIMGWKIEKSTDLERGIEAAGPHTSMLDFPISAMMTLAKRKEVYWLVKDEVFRFPFGWLLRWLGGIPVNRRVPNGMVRKAIELFETYEKIALLITPEGTRGKVEKWRTGLLNIAYGAKVPIVLGYLDWERKIGGAGEEFIPTGDVESDMNRLKSFYSQFKGKHPERQ